MSRSKIDFHPWQSIERLPGWICRTKMCDQTNSQMWNCNWFFSFRSRHLAVSCAMAYSECSESVCCGMVWAFPTSVCGYAVRVCVHSFCAIHNLNAQLNTTDDNGFRHEYNDAKLYTKPTIERHHSRMWPTHISARPCRRKTEYFIKFKFINHFSAYNFELSPRFESEQLLNSTAPPNGRKTPKLRQVVHYVRCLWREYGNVPSQIKRFIVDIRTVAFDTNESIKN